ncbi:MAG: hypothetical protein ACOCQR_02230 [bacterium]
MAKTTVIALESSLDERVIAMIKAIPTTDFAVKLLGVDGNVITLNADEMDMLCEVWRRKTEG